ncbi:hypothetical protein ADIARSV_0718 [Arcticibacter svalbardensis MN12-7]|uniref:DUF4905 domain-containing protein n=1 Tax=Arcticibacter svalbardensis MN12-7 TaxID=1150600 RepID=R9H4H3_9SPHI|nr:hypothetical protein ADIARSV_0718 [Arcticibacter svalbardensis MN12-7]
MTTKYTLKPSLQEKFKGIIWKIETNNINGVIAIETRSSDNKEAFYSAFNFKTGEKLFKEITVEDSWHWSLDKAYNDFVYLHGYISEKSPEHKGIVALNHHGTIAWTAYNKTLETVAEEGLIIYNPTFQQKELELADAATGKIVQNKLSHYTPLNREMYFPETLEDVLLFPAEIEGTLVGPVSYISYNEKDCYSFHCTKDAVTSQVLLIKKDHNTLHKEILEDNISKLNPEPFFIEENHLFCIRNNKREIVTYFV